MTESFVIKLICDNRGAMDYGDLVDIGSGLLDVEGVIDTVRRNDNFSVVTVNGNKRVVVKTQVRLCKARDCTDCHNLHLCKFYLYGDCKRSMWGRECRFCHDMNSEHNARVLRDNSLQELDRNQLCTLLLQNDSTLLPQMCFAYNKGGGAYGNCPDQERCWRLHICDRYLRGACQAGANCRRSHDFFQPHPQKTLQERGLPSQLIGSMLSVYQNIQALKNSDSGPTEKTEICLYFVKGSCTQGDGCWRDHSTMPYKWEVRNGDSWTALPDNEEIERDFCDPSNVYSRGVQPVYFDTMTRGPTQVRRLSTVSSVVQPNFILTTTWAWFWQDEHNNWIQYSSVEGQHGLSSITSEDLERKYQEDSRAVMEFTAGSQTYKFSFPEMIQTNEQFGTKRQVRRRPVFVSTVDAQRARTNRNNSSGNDFKAVPGYWDKSMLPDTGYKTIPLQESSEEYQKILVLFQKTMGGHSIHSVERVQNRALWEAFQWQQDLMRKKDPRRNVNERLLFHGTDSFHVDAICQQNFGKGSYFARDARYSHSYTGASGVRTMFVCRVLVGCYTRGDSSYLRPPSKDGGNSMFYDSCVDNIHNPSIFIVFEKHQIYPEYILKYDEDMWLSSMGAMGTVSSMTQNPKAQRQVFASSVTPKPVPAPPPVSASSVTPKPVQAPPPVSASSVTSKPLQAPPPVSASSETPQPGQAPPPVSASSVTPKPVPAPRLVSASSVTPKPVQAPYPVSASSETPQPGQAPPPVSASSVTPKPVQAPPPVSASSVTPKLVQAPPPFSASSVTPKRGQAPPPVSASSLYPKPVQAPPPVSASSVTPKPLQAPPPVSASSQYPKPVQASPPVSASSVTPKPVPAPRLVSASSVTPKLVQAPPPVSASSVTPKPLQAPPPVSASSQYPKPVQAPPPVSASSVTPKPVQAPSPVSASSPFPTPAPALPPVSASSVTPKPLQAPPPVSASSVTPKPVQAPPPVSASSVTPKPVPAPRLVSASSVTPKPVQAPPPVSASSVTPKPVQALPPVSASSVTPKPVQAPPPVSASSVTPKPVQALPPVSASSVTPKPLKVPPPVRPRSVTLKPTQAPPPVRPRSVTSRVKDLGEMFDPSWGQSSDSTGTASSPSDSSDGTYSQTPTSTSLPTSFPGDGYSPSAATGTSSQSGSTSAMDGSRNEDGSLSAFICRSGLDPK
ncbi:protein mono-ADP-ribosyltransferase PARP12-like isoform X2 [Conger conger]|uniref:protein mono-ADP-ribosyltransferase PARP12-like isoform X2 n=1 Tax=Conger conger TaxID=82655 RepID=UPI002A59D806|nr:protein mono-ADP-ribosyltransferase PARP12-like isoform X2 [Conger conger]